MRKPGLGEASVGAIAGAAVGAIGGLFSLGIARAVLGRDPALLFATPILNLLCWLVSAPIGWVCGGQIGPWLGQKFNKQQAEVIGGALGGMVPVITIGLWGWYMVRPH